MPVRQLDLLDLPMIARYRAQALCLDSAWALTRGEHLSPGSFLPNLNPASQLYAAVLNDSRETNLLGGVSRHPDESFARLTHLAPEGHLEDHERLLSLLEHLAAQAGGWGAFHIVAEVDERSLVFRGLRRAGFNVYAWQRIWDLGGLDAWPARKDTWHKVRSTELVSVQNLYHQIVPALLQPVEAVCRHPAGLAGGPDHIRAYVRLTYGPRGVLARPLIHPDAEQVAEKLTGLPAHIPERRGRPVYLCVRSYQAWLEPVLEDLGAAAGERQAVMVKHLAAAVHRAEPEPLQNHDKAWANPATPVARSQPGTGPGEQRVQWG
jgi:hypothetical protein